MLLADPTGLCFLGCFWNQSWFKPILAIAAAVTAQYEVLAIEEGTTFTAATFAAATTSQAVTAAAMGGVVGGGISTGTLKGALLGGLEGADFAGLVPTLGGDVNSLLGTTSASYVGRFVASGLTGGIFSVVGGGNFGSGFLAAGFGSLAPLGGTFSTGNLIESAVLGGAGSILGGGKFANGAVTAAFAYAASASYGSGNTMGGAEQGPAGNGTGAGLRPLTQGEIDIANTEFPDLNTDPLRITYDESGDAAYTPDNTMHFPTSVSDCLDFSSCDGGSDTGWFVHELTHTWQYQNGISPFWGHIFSSSIFSFGNYLSQQQYLKTPNPANLNTEQQGDWHMWHYLCTNRSSC